jgi:hypothetical protein
MDTGQFVKDLRDYGTPIIAIYGVVQIWLIALWKKLFMKGKIVVFPSGKIEIGHSNFGPTIAINGTLLAKSKDIFVSSMHIDVIRNKDSAIHTFNWVAFRPPVVNILNTGPVSIELPSAFIVNNGSPHRYNICFFDRLVQEEIAPRLIALQQSWGKYLVANTLEIEGLMKTGLSQQAAAERKFNEEFKNFNECREAWDIIQRKVYWEEGDYNGTMEIHTDDSSRIFYYYFNFCVGRESFDKFRTNAVAAIRETCLKETNYYFEYLDYVT